VSETFPPDTWLRTELSVLIFHRVQPNRKIQRRDAAAANIRLRFDAIALSCNAQGVGIDRKFIQLGGVAPALYPLGMDPLKLGTALGGVRAL